jgi:hypothetical protein
MFQQHCSESMKSKRIEKPYSSMKGFGITGFKATYQNHMQCYWTI